MNKKLFTLILSLAILQPSMPLLAMEDIEDVPEQVTNHPADKRSPSFWATTSKFFSGFGGVAVLIAAIVAYKYLRRPKKQTAPAPVIQNDPCPICLEDDITKPLIPPCGHRICVDCYPHLLKTSSYETEIEIGGKKITTTDNFTIARCPICRGPLAPNNANDYPHLRR
jgi:hypothetical protein